MHYKNGREVNIGDKVLVPNGNYTFVGIVASVRSGASSCNLGVVPLANSQSATAVDCLHIDDIAAASIPNSTYDQSNAPATPPQAT